MPKRSVSYVRRSCQRWEATRLGCTTTWELCIRTAWKQIGHSRSCTRLAFGISDCNIRVKTSDRIKSLTLIAHRVPYVRLPCDVSQSVCLVPFPSLLTTRRRGRNHQTPPPPSTKTIAGVTAPLVQSTEIQSRCSLALSDIVKTDNRIFKFDILGKIRY